MQITRRATALVIGGGLAVTGAVTAVGAHAAASSNCPTAYTRAVAVQTASGLKSALAAARPGDEIRLAAGTYVGNFTSAVAGTSTAPVIICGDSTAVLDGGTTASGYVLYVKNAPYTQVRGITVTDGQKGVLLDNSSNSVLDRVTVHGTGQEGVHLRRTTSDTVISNSSIYDTGLVDHEYGEGIYVGSAVNNWCTYTACNPDRSDRNRITGNKIGPGVGAEEVDVKEGTTGGTISGNTFDGTGMDGTGAQSWVDVKGNSWTITANTGRNTVRHGFTDSLASAGWGSSNVFTLNTEYVNSTGYGVKVATGVTGVLVGASNVVVGARSGVANISLAAI